jgi:hypothetical protein
MSTRFVTMLKRMLASSLAPILIATILFTQVGTLRTRASGPSASGNFAALPQRPDIALAAVTESQMPVANTGQPVTTAQDAIALAETRFHLVDGQLDNSVGVVRALVSIRGDLSHQSIKAWVVTANIDTWGQGPATWNTVYHKLSIVIDASTHAYAFAYTSDPQVMTQGP